MRPPDTVIDLGDLLRCEEWIVRGRHLEPVWHVGAQVDSVPADRVPRPEHYAPRHHGRLDFIMDLRADKKVLLSPDWTDEMGNATSPPAQFTLTYTTDAPALLVLTDNGDGTWSAASTGTLGTANVHGDVSFSGRTSSGDVQFVIVAGDAERFAIKVGPEEEVTPDDV